MNKFIECILSAFIFSIVFLGAYLLLGNAGVISGSIKSLGIQVQSIGSGSISLEDFNRNPEDYVGRNVSITGDYHFFSSRKIDGCRLHTIENSDGFQIDFCPSIKRSWDNGKVYTIKGEIKIIDSDSFMYGKGIKYILFEE